MPSKEKAEIAKRLGRSPDAGDAVVLAWSEGQRAVKRGLTGPAYTNGLYGGSGDDRQTSYLSHQNAGERMRARHTNMRQGRRLTHNRQNR